MSNFGITYRIAGGNVADTSGGSTLEAAEAKADRDGFAGAAVFKYLGGVEQKTEVIAIREPGRGWEAFEDLYHVRDWWWALPDAVRTQLAADPSAPLSSEAMAASVRAGLPVASDAWWVGVSDGPSGFYVPAAVQAFIRAVSA